jgi:phage/plasmid primase-like uncharacterized protein
MTIRTYNSPSVKRENNLELDFSTAAARRGLIVNRIIEDSKTYRCPVQGHPGGKDGAYCVFSTGNGGWFVNHTDGLGLEHWFSNTDRELSPAEAYERKQQVEAAARAQREEQEATWRDAADGAEFDWLSADPATNDHPYLIKKNVAAHGLRVENGALIVPIHEVGGKLISLQRIYPNGSKRFLEGGKTAGGMFMLGDPASADLILIGEGFATMASIYEATGYASVVAFTAGNLEAVAVEVKRMFPNAQIIMCGDDDYLTAGNPGVTKANAAAAAVGGKVATPQFDRTAGETGTDFNDMASTKGRETIVSIIKNIIAPEGPEETTMSAEADNIVNLAEKKKEKKARKQLPEGFPEFDKDENGRVRKTKANLVRALNAMGVELTYDEFSLEERQNGVVIDDNSANKLRFDVETKFFVTFPDSMFHQAIGVIAREKSFHPVRDYLDSLTWDGVPRINKLFITYAGAEDTPFNNVVSAKWMIAAVRRARKPGVLVRNVIIEEGPQEIGKSGL